MKSSPLKTKLIGVSPSGSVSVTLTNASPGDTSPSVLTVAVSEYDIEGARFAAMLTVNGNVFVVPNAFVAVTTPFEIDPPAV